jgi:tetratricopeptide (TPR) repeat protein
VRQLHRLAMEAIEELYPPQARGPFFADLVYHAHNANDVWRERRYAHLAGEYAAERFANEEALQYFTRALELTPAEDLLERYALLMAREDVYYLQGLRQAKLQDLKAAQRLAEALDQGELAGLARRAEVALRQARHAEQTGDYATAAAAAQKAVHLARDAEDASQEAAGYLWLGRVLQRQGQDRMARAQLQQALDLARKTGIYQVEINSLRILGTVYLNHYANDGRARTCYRQSLEICRRVNDRQGESRALRRLGNVSLGHPFLEQSSYEDAQQNYLGSLEVSRAIGFRVGEAGALNNLGETEHCLGRLGEAESYYVDALSIFREIGEQLGICVVLGNLCRLFHDLGAYAAALEHGQQALQIAHDMKVPEFVGVSSIDLALAHEGLGQWDEASQAYQHVFTVRRQLGFLHLSMEALAGLVRAALAKDDLPLALHYVEQIMAHEAERQSTGEEDFFRIRLACFRALQAAGDPRAPAVLDQAHQFLQAQASKIQDPALRQSFLQKVPVHRQIRLAWQAQEAG